MEIINSATRLCQGAKLLASDEFMVYNLTVPGMGWKEVLFSENKQDPSIYDIS